MEIMNLFDIPATGNILPYDGEVIYSDKILAEEEANRYLSILLHDIAWKHDEAVIFGRHIITRRMVAWYGDDNYSYTYSNKTRVALPWTKELLELKTLTERFTGTVYNSCLLNLYHNGDEGMAWHSDDEKMLQKDGSIASLSFGATRKFSLKHRVSKETLSLLLESGSLLEMKGSTQTHWLHTLPKSKKIMQPRVNLTFRVMV